MSHASHHNDQPKASPHLGEGFLHASCKGERLTTIDQWELADLVKELGGFYRQLDAREHEKMQVPRGERVMNPTHGPREPGAGWAISLDAQLTADLFEMTRDAINYTDRSAILLARNGTRLCSTIRTNAMEIAEPFPAVDDLADLMRHQIEQLQRKLTPAPRRSRTPPNRPQHLPSAQPTGVQDYPRFAWKMGRMRKIPVTKATGGGSNGYLLREVLGICRNDMNGGDGLHTDR